MESRRLSVRLGLALLLVSALVGCAGGFGSGEVVIEMEDFFYDPAELTFQAGETANIDVVNRGEVEHDIVVTDEVFELGFEAEEAIDARPEIVLGRTDRVAAGEAVSLTVAFDEPGEYQYFCTVLGHFHRGMRGTITVEP